MARPDLSRFGLSAATLRFLKKNGFLRRTDDFDFRELLLLRTMGALRAAQVSTRTIHRTLRDLQPWLSEQKPLSRVSLLARDEQVVVREGDLVWKPDSGQYALPFEDDLRKSDAPKANNPAHDHYQRGAEMEDSNPAAARAAYEACLRGDCTHVKARINLGRLLHLEGRYREAESIYRGTKEPEAILFFNLAVLLEDQRRPAEAQQFYREALMHDPGMADAHFNLALLLERVGDAQAAFRHLLAYRRLSD